MDSATGSAGVSGIGTASEIRTLVARESPAVVVPAEDSGRAELTLTRLRAVVVDFGALGAVGIGAAGFGVTDLGEVDLAAGGLGAVDRAPAGFVPAFVPSADLAVGRVAGARFAAAGFFTADLRVAEVAGFAELGFA